MAKIGTKLCPVDLSSDVYPTRGIWWPRVILCQVSLTFGQPLGQTDLWSDVPPLEASSGQDWYYIMSI